MVEKRDGQVVRFDKDKIRVAVQKAFIEVDGELNDYSKDKAREIANSIFNLDRNMSVEEIQNLVEEKLMNSNRKDVARAYIRYRYDKELVREKNTYLNKEITRSLFSKEDDKQNANVDGKSFGGKMGSVTSSVMKDYSLKHCMSEMSRNNHLSNEIYIHDLDHYAVGDHNCLTIPFDDLLANGFNTRQTDVRPANSVSTAMQLVAVIFQLQSLQQFGGVSSSHLDWTMVPYVRKSFWKHFRDGILYCEEDGQDSEIFTMKNSDKDRSIDDEFWKKSFPKACKYAMDMTIKECKQAVEGMYHNLNY